MAELKFSYSPNKNSEAVGIDKKKDRLIYLNTHSPLSGNEIFDIFHEWSENKKLTQRVYDELLQALENDDIPEDARLRKLYESFKLHMRKCGEVRLEDIEVVPLIGENSRNAKTRECILVNGCNGSGKSVWVGQYTRKWQKLFPSSPIWLFSNKPLQDEPAFDKIKMKQIPLEIKTLTDIVGKSNLMTNSKLLKELEDQEFEELAPYQHFISKTGQSLVIFDDFESDGKIETLIRQIMASILRVGRASRIYCIIISHSLCAGQKTKVLFEEVDALVLFNKGISPYHIKYALTNYTKMDAHQIAKIIDSSSRWVYIHKTQPTYVIEQSKMWLY